MQLLCFYSNTYHQSRPMNADVQYALWEMYIISWNKVVLIDWLELHIPCQCDISNNN